MLPVFLLRCCSMWGASPLLGSIIETWLHQGQRVCCVMRLSCHERPTTPRRRRGGVGKPWAPSLQWAACQKGEGRVKVPRTPMEAVAESLTRRSCIGLARRISGTRREQTGRDSLCDPPNVHKPMLRLVWQCRCRPENLEPGPTRNPVVLDAVAVVQHECLGQHVNVAST